MATGLLDPRVDALINMIQPVNLLHHLNRGLVSWWLVLSGTTGSSRLMDIVSPGPDGLHGVLDGPLWVPGISLGSWGALDFDGSDDFVNLGPNIYEPNDSQQLSVFVRVKVAETTNHHTVIGGFEGLSTTPGWYFYWNKDQPALVHQGAGGAGGGAFISDLFTPSTTEPETWGVSLDQSASTATFYRNGVAIGTDAGGRLGTPGVADFYIGARNNNGTADLLFQGAIDSVHIWNRFLSGDEHAQLEQLSRQRYPGMLNRVATPRATAAAIAAAKRRRVGFYRRM